MKKFINAVDNMLRESLTGLAQAQPRACCASEFEPTFVARRTARSGKVTLISGGGSGHEPLHAGFVGPGMLDAACPGQVFTSPTPDQMLAAAQAKHGGERRAVHRQELQRRHDELPARLGDARARQRHRARQRRRRGRELHLHDRPTRRGRDADRREGDRRRGRTRRGSVCMQGRWRPREQCDTASMGVAFTSCTVPAAGRPTFDIGPEEVEMGVGIHGEPGRRREKFRPADALVKDLMDAILADLKPARGREVLLHVNGFGGTPLMELYLLFNRAAERAAERRPEDRALAGRQLHDLARDGRRFADADLARRRDRSAVGRAGADRRASLVARVPRTRRPGASACAAPSRCERRHVLSACAH